MLSQINEWLSDAREYLSELEKDEEDELVADAVNLLEKVKESLKPQKAKAPVAEAPPTDCPTCQASGLKSNNGIHYFCPHCGGCFK